MPYAKAGLRTRLVALLILALVPGFALLAWLRADMRGLHATELERSVIQLAQLAAQGQASRDDGAAQLLRSFAANPAVRSGDPVLCGEFFGRLLEFDGQVYANFGFIAPDGDLLCAGVPPKGRINVADRAYFRDALRNRRITMSELATGRITGRSIVTYTLPVLDGDRVLGVAFASMDIHGLSRSLERVALPEGGVLVILDRTGAVAARIPRLAPDEIAARVVLPAGRSDGVIVRETTGRDGRLRLYAAVPVNAERTMYAVAGLPVSAMTATADRRMTAALLILLGCSVLVFSVALLGAEYQIRRPVMRLLGATTRIGGGDVHARAGDSGGARELRELGRSFDRMADLLTAREAQMRQSQRLEAVGQLAGGVAHDFNNILTAIIGFGEELREHVSDPSGRQYLQEVLSAADRAKDLTHQLLAFSRRQVLQPATLQLNAVIAEFTALLQRVIGEDIALVTRLGSDLAQVRADRTQIEQVLMNLVVNARDAMPNGGLLTIETDNAHLGPADALPEAVGEEGGVPPGAYVRLRVTDTGGGIDAETRSRMFEPFFTTKGAKGTGLGLATVYGIVRQSGGYVSCRSEVGAGATFSVLLPRTAVTAEERRRPLSAVSQGGGTETVLVVEDEPSVRALAATVLRHRGYSVVDVPSGAAALEQLDRGLTPDLLLCDVVMPSMNGHQVAEAVRARHPRVRVVYMSGYDNHAMFPHGTRADGAFIQKPFSPADLCRQVRSALDPAAI